MSEHASSTAQRKTSFWRRAYRLYADGFRTMSRTSRVLWIIILAKLFIMFAILRAFFFPNVVGLSGDKTQQVNHVVDQLTKEEYTEGEISLWYGKKHNQPNKEPQPQDQ